MATKAWPQIAQLTLSDRVFQAIRDRILDGELAPGEFIREQEVSEAMGVSRTPLREALGRLSSEGFLERIPHRGFRVPAEPVRELLDLYPVVAALELLAGRLALPRLEPHDVRQLKKINHELAQCTQRKNVSRAQVRELVALNDQFHHLFCERSGNRRLCSMLDDFRSQIQRLEMWYYSYPEHTTKSVEEHDRIIRGIEAGDHDEALAAIEQNMALTYKALADETGKVDIPDTLTRG